MGINISAAYHMMAQHRISAYRTVKLQAQIVTFTKATIFFSNDFTDMNPIVVPYRFDIYSCTWWDIWFI